MLIKEEAYTPQRLSNASLAALTGSKQDIVTRIAEIEAALKPFAEAFDMFAKREAFTRVLSLGQLGRLAAGEVSGAHFKTVCDVLTKSD